MRPFALLAPFCSFPRCSASPSGVHRPRLPRWGFALSLPAAKGGREGESSRGRGTAAPDLLPTALAGAAPTASAYWRYRWVLIMPSALAAIQMLKLFICSWVSSRQRRNGERLPPPRPPRPSVLAGTGPAAPSQRLCPGGPRCPPTPPASSRPVFPRSRCWSARLWDCGRGDSARFTLR